MLRITRLSLDVSLELRQTAQVRQTSGLNTVSFEEIIRAKWFSPVRASTINPREVFWGWLQVVPKYRVPWGKGPYPAPPPPSYSSCGENGTPVQHQILSKCCCSNVLSGFPKLGSGGERRREEGRIPCLGYQMCSSSKRSQDTVH